MADVTYELSESHAVIRLTRGTTNALTTEMLRTVIDAVGNAPRDGRGLMLCGGDKFFSNGVDLDWALSQTPGEIRDMFLALGDCILNLVEAPMPVVGVAKGHAIGGACAMLLACDYRFAATGRVLIGKPEILLGVPNPYFGDQLLRFVAGDFVASDLIYSGRLVTGEDACDLNMVHEVGAQTEIEAMALQRLDQLCELAPEAFVETKHMRLGRFCADVRQQMSARVARQVEIWFSDDAQTRLRAAAERLAR